MNFSLNKTVATLGLIAASTAAWAADSSVSVYGRIDTAIESVKTGSERVNGVNNNGSYFGFKGQEELGNGLKVGFQLESAFNSDTGAISEEAFFSNRSELNLSGDFGTVRMGRFFNPSYYATADRTSLHNDDYGITADALYAAVENPANRIAYKSPEFHGLSVETAVSLHERNADNQGKNAYDLAANYERGNWSFGAGYGEWADAKQYALRATWTTGAWTVSGYHQRSQDVDKFTGLKEKANVTRAAVAYAIGAGEIHANFGYANAAGLAAANQWTVGYNHHLSKRTKVYAFYTQLQNKNGATYGDLPANDDRKAVSVGVRHSF